MWIRKKDTLIAQMPVLAMSFAIIILALSVGRGLAQTHLTFCYDPYPPYAIGASGPAEGGSKVALLAAVVERIEGITADAVIMPWKRCQAEAKAGNVDGILPLFKSAERSEYLAFSRGTFRQTSGFWYSEERFPGRLTWEGSFEDLSTLRLGMVSGSIIDETMEAAFQDGEGITRARDVQTLMTLLLKDRVDVVAVDDAVARYTLDRNGWDGELISIRRPISTRISYFGLSRASGADQFLAAFDSSLDDLAASGALQDIYLSLD